MNDRALLFPQLVPTRMRSVLERVSREIWYDEQPVMLAQAAVTPRFIPWSEARSARLRRVTPPFHWGRRFEQTWFQVTGLNPRAGVRRWLRWRDQGEATLYVNGEPAAGFDVAHRTAPLPAKSRDVWVQSICCQSAIWHPEATGLDAAGSRFAGAETVRRNELAWKCYHDLSVLHDLSVEEWKIEDPDFGRFLGRPGGRPAPSALASRLRRLLRFLEQAADAFDSGGLAALQRELDSIYRRLRADRDALRASLVAHAHIDLVWLWPERIGEAKAVHTFATVDRLLSQYPEMRFSYSQPASYEAVERTVPKLMQRVRRRIAAGQWEATGATYVESDTLLACGEALLRSFQLGQEWFVDNLGRPARTLWLPDVFGYAGCVPQLARMSGVDYFFTNKLTWSRISTFPHSSFIWRGSDGSELVAHVSHEAQQFYNGATTLRELRDGARGHRQADVHDEFLVPTGYGDGGGGPTDEMCERARRLADLAGVPRARWSRVEDFFRRLRRRRGLLPVWTGEIYLEYHRGTYTTHGELKAAFRMAERGLQIWEAAHCLSGRGKIDPGAWKRLVFSQFHDAIPGSSINQVYAELRPELAALHERSMAAAQVALEGDAARPAWFNPLPQPLHVVTHHAGEVMRATLLPLARTERRQAKAVRVEAVSATNHSLDNGLVRARFNGDGEITELFVRGIGVALDGPAARLSIHPDHPHAFDAWELDQHTLRLGRFLRGGHLASEIADGGVAGCVTHTRSVGTGSKIITRYRLVAGESVLRIDYDIDWRKPQMLLKASFPTNYRGQHARFGSPFGSVRREQWQGRPGAEAQWEVPGSRWAVISDDGEREGLMLLTEAKYGFGCRAGVLDVSLLRSATITGESSAQAQATPHLSKGRAKYPRHSDLGRHVIRLAVGMWNAGVPRAEMPAALADTLFTAPLDCCGKVRNAGFLGLEGGDSLVPAWAKPITRGRWLLRLHETMGCRGAVRLQLEPGWRVRRAGELDRPEGTVESAVAFSPYAVVSLILERKR